MSDSEEDASVLGKRARNRNDIEDGDVPENAPPPNQAEDDDDDDVGPMPMPEATNGGTKKKRKGTYIGHYLLGTRKSDYLYSSASRTGV
jgi:peptidylprolyl isomerase domain and WD repeat-containing protein 1